uniref:protein phosphatase 1 regulatory subunit 12C-like n=1 Tax=Lonchura striata TaxID=40157 RepID=UPI000B4CA5F0|nr:protein phosphatase 1 regulatory subunit 12C-like [Lonchura striata domestica]
MPSAPRSSGCCGTRASGWLGVYLGCAQVCPGVPRCAQVCSPVPGVDVADAKRAEEQRLLRDTRLWLASGRARDRPLAGAGASALHVAAAKGYIEVMRLLLAAGCDPDVRDEDGWTPLHAAAHWGEREACRLLCEHLCDMSPQNNVGQRPCDLADEETLPLLEELQRRQLHVRAPKRPKTGQNGPKTAQNGPKTGVTLPELRAAEHGIGRGAEGRGQQQPIRDQEGREPNLEEELKALSDLRADNQRLKDENAALIRVISKLSK